MRIFWFSLYVYGIFCLVSNSSFANSSSLCHAPISQIEKQMRLPKNLLNAISLGESGLYNKEQKQIQAWPWTINVEGKGYYFDSKAEAVSRVKQLQNQGIKSIDVGCMQISLLWHPEAFETLEQAFDPKSNITYAAQFLTDLKKQHGSWRKAIGYYHSGTPEYAQKYQDKILALWNGIKPSLNARKPVPPSKHQFALLNIPQKPIPLLPITPQKTVQPAPKNKQTSPVPQAGSLVAGSLVMFPLDSYREPTTTKTHLIKPANGLTFFSLNR